MMTSEMVTGLPTLGNIVYLEKFFLQYKSVIMPIVDHWPMLEWIHMKYLSFVQSLTLLVTGCLTRQGQYPVLTFIDQYKNNKWLNNQPQHILVYKLLVSSNIPLMITKIEICSVCFHSVFHFIANLLNSRTTSAVQVVFFDSSIQLY